MKALFVPGADRTTQWFGDKYDGLIMGDLDKILLHSTETLGWPGYGGGGSAPTLTIDPWNRKIRQHFVLNESARALLNPSATAVSENKDQVCQIEIIGYSDAVKARSIGRSDRDLRNLSDADLRWIANILVFIMKEWGVPNIWADPFPWPSYPSSYGRTSSRMTSAEYDRFEGILGHLHASGNTHGDPTLDVAKLRRYVTELLKPTAPTPTPVGSKEITVFALVRATSVGPEVYKTDGFRRQHVGPLHYRALLKTGLKVTELANKTELEAFGPVEPNPGGAK